MVMPAFRTLALFLALLLTARAQLQAASNTTVCDAACQSQQRQALLDLYTTLGGPGWARKEGFDTSSSHCTWSGVVCCEPAAVLSAPETCSDSGPVVALEWEDNNLTGSLPAAPFTALAPSLMLLVVHGNELTGTIPDTLSACSLLRVLDVSANKLGGTVPAWLGGLTSLNHLQLADNRFVGNFTPPVTNWTSMRFLHVERNCLRSFPVEALALPLLESINFDNNCLVGTLPATPPAGTRQYVATPLERIGIAPEYGYMTKVSLRNNSLGGSIPPYMVNLPVGSLWLSSNNFTGQLPDWTRNNMLVSLHLGNNHLTGSLPNSIIGPSMVDLDLSANKLGGPLPSAVGDVSNLDSLLLGSNVFTGVLPPSYAQLAGVNLVDLQRNNFSRGNTLPTWMQLQSGMDRSRMTRVDSRLSCPQLHTVAGPNYKVLLDPSYYGYEGCTCDEPYVVSTIANQAGRTMSLTCTIPAAPPQVDLRAVLIPLLVTVAVLLLLLGLVFKFGLRAIVAQMRGSDKKSPPGASHEVTLVLTDVQGSTELWEWDTELAAEAFLLHDRLLRTFMAAFYGYEVSTEGDAFLVAFHEPFDAVAWCLAVQLALHYADWPPALLEFSACAEESVADLQEKRRRRTKKWEDKVADSLAAGRSRAGDGDGGSSVSSSQGGGAAGAPAAHAAGCHRPCWMWWGSSAAGGTAGMRRAAGATPPQQLPPWPRCCWLTARCCSAACGCA